MIHFGRSFYLLYGISATLAASAVYYALQENKNKKK